MYLFWYPLSAYLLERPLLSWQLFWSPKKGGGESFLNVTCPCGIQTTWLLEKNNWVSLEAQSNSLGTVPEETESPFIWNLSPRLGDHLVSLNFLSFRSSLLKPQLDFDSLSGTPCLLSPSLAPFTSAWVSEVQVYVSVRTALIDKYNENVSFLSGLHFIGQQYALKLHRTKTKHTCFKEKEKVH